MFPEAPREGPPIAGCGGLLLVGGVAVAIAAGLLYLLFHIAKDL